MGRGDRSGELRCPYSWDWSNGLLVLWLRAHPLIVTLGMGAVLQGGILYYANGPAGGVPDGFSTHPLTAATPMCP